jgi:4-amino-4-deoxy-L-arabinose transferase-like glycosyltransferase
MLGVQRGLLLIGVAALVLVPGMWVSLIDRDEGWYAQVAREMVRTGDWLMPRYLGEVWIAKPPLLYWLVAASYRVLGIGEWQARLVPVIASVVSTLLVGALGARMFGRRVGLFSGLLFITYGLPALVGKMLLTDQVLLVFILTAVLLHWRMATAGVTHARAAAYWLAVGAGVMAKGPAVLVFAGAFALALLIARLWHRRDACDAPARRRCHTGWAVPSARNWIRDWRWWVWMPLALFVAVPWYVYVALHAGETLRAQFLGYEVMSRITGAPHGHGGPPGYYLLLSLAGLLPWTPLIPGALAAAWAARRGDAGGRVLLAWLAIPWVVLELIYSKLPHYILPCYVPLAILLARSMAASYEDRRRWAELPRPERGVLGIWVGLMAALGVAWCVAVAVKLWGEPVSIPHVTAPGWMLLSAALVAALLLKHRGVRWTMPCVFALIVGFYVSLGAGFLPEIERYRLSPRVADAVNATARPGDVVYVCGYEEPSVFFYLREGARPLRSGEFAEHVLAATQPATFAIARKQWDDLAPEDRSRLQPLLTGSPVRGLNYVKMQRTEVLVGRTGETLKRQ